MNGLNESTIESTQTETVVNYNNNNNNNGNNNTVIDDIENQNNTTNGSDIQINNLIDLNINNGINGINSQLLFISLIMV